MRKVLLIILAACLLACMPLVSYAAPDNAPESTPASSAGPEESAAPKETEGGEEPEATAGPSATAGPTEQPAQITYREDAPTLDTERITSQSAMLIDAETGEVLFAKNAEERIYPASTTKLMTALLASESRKLEDTVTLTEEMMSALSQLGENGSLMHLIRLDVGDEISVKDLMHGLLMCSGNDAALVLGMDIAGTESAFVDMMNAKAQELGMTGTHFVNPHGVYVAEVGDDHYSTAEDMAKLALAAYQVPMLTEIMGKDTYHYESVSGLLSSEELGDDTIENSNYLLHTPQAHPSYDRYRYEGTTGMKTGLLANIQPPDSEDLIRSYGCLVASAARGDLDLIALVFGDTSLADEEGAPPASARWGIAAELFDYGFEQFTKVDVAQYVTAATLTEQVESVVEETQGHELTLHADISGVQPDLRLLPVATAQGLADGSIQLEQRVDLGVGFTPPINVGDTVGTVSFLLDGQEVYTAPLVSEGTVMPVVNVPSDEEEENKGAFSFQPWYLFFIIPAGFVGTLLLLRAINLSRRKRRRRNRYAGRYGAAGTARRSPYAPYRPDRGAITRGRRPGSRPPGR